jgi:hypothetical protein
MCEPCSTLVEPPDTLLDLKRLWGVQAMAAAAHCMGLAKDTTPPTFPSEVSCKLRRSVAVLASLV